MEFAAALTNSQWLREFISNTGGQITSSGEAVLDRSWNPTHDKQQRVDRLAEYFTQQFSWPHASTAAFKQTTESLGCIKWLPN